MFKMNYTHNVLMVYVYFTNLLPLKQSQQAQNERFTAGAHPVSLDDEDAGQGAFNEHQGADNERSMTVSRKRRHSIMSGRLTAVMEGNERLMVNTYF